MLDGPIGRLTVAAAGDFRNVTPPPAPPADDDLRGLRARALLPDGRVEIVDGAGRALNGEFPEVVNERVLAFVTEVDRG